MDGHSLTEAHYTVLQNSALVAPYMDEHKNFLRSKHPERSDDWITREQTRSFAGWLQTRTMHDASIEDDLYLLSQLPSSNIMTFKGYKINGNTFYTIAPNTRSGLMTGLHVNKPGVSPAGCRHVPCMTPLLKMTCTCCPSYHLRI